MRDYYLMGYKRGRCVFSLLFSSLRLILTLIYVAHIPQTLDLLTSNRHV